MPSLNTNRPPSSKLLSQMKRPIHSNETWAIAINGSPNYTNNPRIEAGVVTENRLVARAHKGWIEAEMAKAKPFGEHLSKKLKP